MNGFENTYCHSTPLSSDTDVDVEDFFENLCYDVVNENIKMMLLRLISDKNEYCN